MDKIKLNIDGLSHSHNDLGAYALILSEDKSTRKIPIIMARAEAMAIAFSLEDKKYLRPFTHDLLQNIIKKMGGQLLEVVLSKVESGIFYADIILMQRGEIFNFTARPSDAIALAIKNKASVYANPSVIKKASFDFDEIFEETSKNEQADKPQPPHISTYSLSQLKQMLKEAIEKEDYERASILKIEIDKQEYSPN